MATLVGVLFSYAVLATGGSAPAEICTAVGARCEAPAAAALGEVATPAEVDCRSAEGALTAAAVADSLLLGGACDQPPSLPWYRASRAPERGGDSQRAAGAVTPQRARRAAARVLATCDRAPEPVPALADSVAPQPLAIAAVPALPPPRQQALFDGTLSIPPTRMLEPLDRPPRA